MGGSYGDLDNGENKIPKGEDIVPGADQPAGSSQQTNVPADGGDVGQDPYLLTPAEQLLFSSSSGADTTTDPKERSDDQGTDLPGSVGQPTGSSSPPGTVSTTDPDPEEEVIGQESSGPRLIRGAPLKRQPSPSTPNTTVSTTEYESDNGQNDAHGKDTSPLNDPDEEEIIGTNSSSAHKGDGQGTTSSSAQKDTGAGEEEKDSDEDDQEDDSKLSDKQKIWKYIVKPKYSKRKNSLTLVSDECEDEENFFTVYDHISNAASATSSILSLESGIHAMNSGIQDPSKADSHIKENSSASDIISGTFGAINTAFGLYKSSMAAYKLHNVKKRKHLSKINETRLDFWSNALGTASSLLGSAASFSSMDGKGDAATSLSIFSSGADFIGSMLGTAGRYQKAYRHGDMAQGASKEATVDKQTYEGIVSQARQKQNKNDPNLKEQKRIAKARYEAMRQAQAFNSAKAEQEKSGAFRDLIFGTGGSLVGMLGGMVSSALGGTDLGLSSVIGGGAGLLQMGMKYAGKFFDWRKGNKDKNTNSINRHKVINEYLESKRDKVKAIIQDNDHTRGINVTDDVADIISIARLGIDVKFDDDPYALSSEVYKELYNRITLMRVNNIKKLPDAEKDQIRTSLGLPDNPTDDEIAEALGYEK